MELRHLRNFVALAETLNFTRAAESLFISQPTLSQQIAEMERELGVVLFKRTRRVVELTEAGETLLHEARRALVKSDQIFSAVRDAAKNVREPNREIRIGIESLANTHNRLRRAIADAAFRCRADIAGMHVFFMTCEHEELTQAIATETIDMGFFIHHAPDPAMRPPLAFTRLAQENVVMAFRSGKTYPDTAKSVAAVLRKHGLVLLEKESKSLHMAMRLLERIKVEAPIRFISDRNIMIYMVESGEFATFLPESVARDFNAADLQMLRLPQPEATLHLFAVYNESPRNRLVPRMVELMREFDNSPEKAKSEK